MTNDEIELTVTNPSHGHSLRHDIAKYPPECLICQESGTPEFYKCYLCDFSLCPACARKPLIVEPKRSHEHPLTLMPKSSFIFTCDACGVGDLRSPLCLCIPCCFAIHRDCVDLPRVICINLHDEHRISFVLPLGVGEWKCGVCRKKVDGEYGAFSCSTCPNYAVHSRCAIKWEVWDQIELEGVPEEDPQEIAPFTVVGDDVIKHFSHEHNLKHIKQDAADAAHYESKQCNACILPIYPDPCYICTNSDCDFILHEVCANLPKKKRHPADPERFTLFTEDEGGISCSCCEQIGSGFAYIALGCTIDIRCALIRNGYIHKSHPHSALFFLFRAGRSAICSNCNQNNFYMLRCDECDNFCLCFRCATLPSAVKNKYDQHPLYLSYGENTNGEYWCEICEEKTDPTKWFYTCDECSSTLHITCVVGRKPYFRNGFIHKTEDFEIQILPNNYMTRPHCRRCSSRCEGPLVMKTLTLKDWFHCFNCTV